MRLSLPLYEIQLKIVRAYIENINSIIIRTRAPSGPRIEATLLYLTTEINYSRLQYSVRISVLSVSAIIPETCRTIFAALKDDYLKEK